MAGRGNVPDADSVHSISDNEDTDVAVAVDTTDHPFSASQQFRSNRLSTEIETHDYFYHGRSGLNSTDRPCRMWTSNVTGNGDRVEDNPEIDGESSSKSSESGYEVAGSMDYVKCLNLSADGGSDKTGKNKVDNTNLKDTEEVASKGGEDGNNGQKNSLERFLEFSNLFLQNMMARARDFSPKRPRE